MALPTETRTWNTLFSTTWDLYAEEASDNWLTSNPIMDLLKRKGRVDSKNGGARIDVTVNYGFNPGSQWYAGADELDMTPFEVSTTAKYDWKNLHAPVTRTGEEVRKNNGEYQRQDLVRSKIRATENTLAKVLEIALCGNGTAAGGKVILGLEALFPTTPTSDPAVGAIGGISVTGNTWWQNYAVTSFGSFAANGPGGTAADAFLNTWNAVSDGSDTPDIIVSAQDVFEFYTRAIVDQTQIVMTQNATGTLTFASIMYMGIPWVWSRNIAAGRAYLLRSSDLKFYTHPEANMTMSEWTKSYNQDLFGTSVLSMCAFVPIRRMLTAVVDGITA
jgi:hypothetical protein